MRAESASSVSRSALMERAAIACRPLHYSSAIDALQLPLGNRDGALGVFAAGAVVGEHVDDEEVGDRGCRLLADLADAGRGQRTFARLLEHRVLRVGGPY